MLQKFQYQAISPIDTRNFLKINLLPANSVQYIPINKTSFRRLHHIYKAFIPSNQCVQQTGGDTIQYNIIQYKPYTLTITLKEVWLLYQRILYPGFTFSGTRRGSSVGSRPFLMQLHRQEKYTHPPLFVVLNKLGYKEQWSRNSGLASLFSSMVFFVLFCVSV